MDKLENIFNLQEQLNSRIGVNMNDMSDEDRTKWILNYVRAMQQELAELTDSVPWKWWAKYQEFDKQNAKVEIVDLFHFLISLAQVMGMSAADVHEAYLKKNKVNHNRQDSGYSSKDENDSKHI
jgi:dimeric dUTPase (all-alpha-NTP-PPase superfamily)